VGQVDWRGAVRAQGDGPQGRWSTREMVHKGNDSGAPCSPPAHHAPRRHRPQADDGLAAGAVRGPGRQRLLWRRRGVAGGRLGCIRRWPGRPGHAAGRGARWGRHARALALDPAAEGGAGHGGLGLCEGRGEKGGTRGALTRTSRPRLPDPATTILLPGLSTTAFPPPPKAALPPFIHTHTHTHTHTPQTHMQTHSTTPTPLMTRAAHGGPAEPGAAPHRGPGARGRRAARPAVHHPVRTQHAGRGGAPLGGAWPGGGAAWWCAAWVVRSLGGAQPGGRSRVGRSLVGAAGWGAAGRAQRGGAWPGGRRFDGRGGVGAAGRQWWGPARWGAAEWGAAGWAQQAGSGAAPPSGARPSGAQQGGRSRRTRGMA
jgi:hypothetical protein